MFICGVSDDGIQSQKAFSDWASFNGRIWHKTVLENETEAVIGLFHERNVVRLWAEVSLGGVLRDIPKIGCRGD